MSILEDEVPPRYVVSITDPLSVGIHGRMTDEMRHFLSTQVYNSIGFCEGDWRGQCDFLLEKKEQIVRVGLREDFVDYDVIHQLTELDKLSISYQVPKLQFHHFKKLRELSIDWFKGCDESFYDLTSIMHLHISNWKEIDCRKLTKLKNLERLDLVDARKLKSLDGLECLPNLKRIDLYCITNLNDISALSKLPNLEQIHIEGCKRIEYPTTLAGLNSLEALEIYHARKIPSFSFIQQCPNLKVLTLGATSCEDGDFSFVEQLTNLRYFFASGARHYSPETKKLLKELPKRLSQKYPEFDVFEILEKYRYIPD